MYSKTWAIYSESSLIPETQNNSMMHVDTVEPHRVGGIVAIRSGVAEKYTDLINWDGLHLLPASNAYQELVQLQLMGMSGGRTAQIQTGREHTSSYQCIIISSQSYAEKVQVFYCSASLFSAESRCMPHAPVSKFFTGLELKRNLLPWQHLCPLTDVVHVVCPRSVHIWYGVSTTAVRQCHPVDKKRIMFTKKLHVT